jgi:hypothetical protein
MITNKKNKHRILSSRCRCYQWSLYSVLCKLYLTLQRPGCSALFTKCRTGLNRCVQKNIKCVVFIFSNWTIPMAAESEAWVCDRCVAGIAGSNPAGGKDVWMLWVLCVVTYGSLRRADHSYRVLQSVVCLSVIAELKDEESLSHYGFRAMKKNM